MFSQVYSRPETLYIHSWNFFKMFFSSGKNKKRDSLSYPFLKVQLSNLSNFYKSRIFRLYLWMSHFISHFFQLSPSTGKETKKTKEIIHNHMAGSIGPLFLFYICICTWTKIEKYKS